MISKPSLTSSGYNKLAHVTWHMYSKTKCRLKTIQQAGSIYFIIPLQNTLFRPKLWSASMIGEWASFAFFHLKKRNVKETLICCRWWGGRVSSRITDQSISVVWAHQWNCQAEMYGSVEPGSGQYSRQTAHYITVEHQGWYQTSAQS